MELRHECTVSTIFDDIMSTFKQKHLTHIVWSIDILIGIRDAGTLENYDESFDREFILDIYVCLLFAHGGQGFNEILKDESLFDFYLKVAQKIANWYQETAGYKEEYVKDLDKKLYLARFMRRYNYYSPELARFFDLVQFVSK